MVLIGESQSFSMTANVESPGFVRMIPRGGIIKRTPSGTYVTQLLPQMFLGASGEQLTSWRQYLSSAGSQTVLSKPAGKLLVPESELYWRRISRPPSRPPTRAVSAVARFEVNPWINLVWILPLVAVIGYAAYKGFKR